MAKSKKYKDDRVNAKRAIWAEYLIILLVMLCLTGGQALILAQYSDILTDVPLSFLFANIGYWGLMTFVFCLITRHMRRRTWEKPMKTLSAAAKQVAEGDFSVHVDPTRKDGKKDYVEVMFDDFNTMVTELGSIETLTGDFVANVSHEIKTPLSVIQSYAMALRKTDLPEDKRCEYADTIISASAHLNTLVTNILKLSKLETQEFVQDREYDDLCAQLATCALQFEEQWEEKQITFTATMDDRCVISADSELLSIVWSNLLSNAIKFSEPHGEVTLTQTSDANSTTVTITDTGVGIDENIIERIFDKFYQGDTSHSGDGNGLGLALTKRVVDTMDGQINVSSEVGKGSSFSVTLPLKY
jgi:signal transduction histidine kinase